jgi:hypothetical protein
MNINWIDILTRAAWTFLEGFLIALPTTLSIGMDGAAWKSALLGAAMAGLSALKTFAIELIRKYKTKPETATE